MNRGPQRHPLTLSRTLMLGWCLWLLLSWTLNLALFPARGVWRVAGDEMLLWQAPPEAFIPMVRGMMLSVLGGLMLVWPAWRLSQRGHAGVGRETALDLAALWLIAQVVIWPMQLLSGFSVARLSAISVTLGVWGAATGVVVGWGRLGESAPRRTLAMGACVGMAMGPWVWMIAGGTPRMNGVSPIDTLWNLCDTGPHDPHLFFRLGIVSALTLSAWGVLIASAARRSGRACSLP